MKLNQDAKSLLAVMALVGAVVLAVNGVVAPAGGREMFPWSLGLLAVALLFWIWLRRDARPEETGDASDAVDAAEDAAAEAEALVKRREVRRDVQPVSQAAPDDLTRLKGIAAGYQRLLNEAGIRTYAELAGRSADDLRAIFSAASRPSPAALESLPRQAELAAKGDWESLKTLQDSL